MNNKAWNWNLDRISILGLVQYLVKLTSHTMFDQKKKTSHTMRGAYQVCLSLLLVLWLLKKIMKKCKKISNFLYSLFPFVLLERKVKRKKKNYWLIKVSLDLNMSMVRYIIWLGYWWKTTSNHYFEYRQYYISIKIFNLFSIESYSILRHHIHWSLKTLKGCSNIYCT